jgi:hypothetical protein
MLVVQVLREFAVEDFFPTSQESKGFFFTDKLHTRVRTWKPLSPPRKVAPAKERFRAPQTKNFFFGSQVFGFWETRLVWILAPTRLSLRGSHVRRKFWKRTTLRSESSTFTGLLYAGWRSRCEVFVARNAALSPWSEAWARKLSYDKQQSTFFTSWISFVIPAWAVPRSLANARKGQLKDFWWERKVWVMFRWTDVHSRRLPQVRKGENVPVVLLLLSYTSVLLLRKPCVLYQKHGGACTRY